MEASTIDIDNLFVKGKCIVSVQENGQTKVAVCNLNETFPKTDNKWKILGESKKGQKENITHVQEKKQYKTPYVNVLQKSDKFHIGFYLIRDLLNMKKLNSFSSVFIFNSTRVNRVIICGNIISVERRNQHYRLVINDGTSSMLCLRTIDEGLEGQMTLGQFKNKNHAESFDNSSLGKTVKIIGYLKEYMETNFIFAHHISWMSQQGFVDFMEYVIDLYRLKTSISVEK